jgi:hypothetical protein
MEYGILKRDNIALGCATTALMMCHSCTRLPQNAISAGFTRLVEVLTTLICPAGSPVAIPCYRSEQLSCVRPLEGG